MLQILTDSRYEMLEPHFIRRCIRFPKTDHERRRRQRHSIEPAGTTAQRPAPARPVATKPGPIRRFAFTLRRRLAAMLLRLRMQGRGVLNSTGAAVRFTYSENRPTLIQGGRFI